MSRHLVPVYIITIFLSAFLLFAFQPMVGKFLLPSLGGTPAVWNTAMLFFQVLLLAGYIYAHLLTRIKKPQIQAVLHLSLMAIAAMALPLALPGGTGNPDQEPVIWQLKTMIAMAAGPFFILSASAPLLQNWFSRTDHVNAGNPYFLYAASNVGSMLALLSYPVVLEPLLTLHEQSYFWSAGYFLLAAMFVFCASTPKFHRLEEKIKEEDDHPVPLKTKLVWIFLAFCPSSLMLGYTTHITTDIASMPLFWVLPLALYLGTFIIAFSNKPFFPLPLTRILQAFLFILLACIQIFSFDGNGAWLLIFFHGAFFFFTALMCHQELVALKPKVSRLTEFYLYLSIGGALGGVFNSLIAPILFQLPYEYYVVIILSLFARYASTPIVKNSEFKIANFDLRQFALFPGVLLAGSAAALIDHVMIKGALVIVALIASLLLLNRRIAFAMTAGVILILNPPNAWMKKQDSLLITRNFFGVLRVQDYDETGMRILSHGTTNHGAQALNPEFKKIPLTYYHPASSVGDIFKLLDKSNKPQKIAALGLGIGSIACYQHSGREFDFYEINQQVIDISEDPKYFSYLKDCGSPYKIILGDARRKIIEAPDKSYDMIFVDVFSSDNIPVHVMTLEAIQEYKKKLKDGGFIVIHVSNRYFDLTKEVSILGNSAGMEMRTKQAKGGDISGTNIKYNPTIYTVMSDNPSIIADFEKNGWEAVTVNNDVRPWTDDYANIIRALK